MRFQNKSVLFVSILMIYITTVHTYALEKAASDILLDQHNAENQDVQTSFEKRAMPLSLNGDLRMLARMLFASQRRRRVDQYASVRQQMAQLGKRSSDPPFDKDEEDSMRNGQDETPQLTEHQTKVKPAISKFQLVSTDELKNLQKLHSRPSLGNDNVDEFQKRGQRLSINGALSSLADMLAASGRRRLEEELAVNKQRLLKLGR
ncbi:uncharacterized protein LOC117316767 [Pecten maximus]|uniref:uncharacterized protein LOC117316767 n=1 Tax=Pecten maximus TaxID=6579 RepID=UPI001457FEDE|nr:uncharacterized protein LOC117316767 [Pecten maximus]